MNPNRWSKKMTPVVLPQANRSRVAPPGRVLTTLTTTSSYRRHVRWEAEKSSSYRPSRVCVCVRESEADGVCLCLCLCVCVWGRYYVCAFHSEPLCRTVPNPHGWDIVRITFNMHDMFLSRNNQSVLNAGLWHAAERLPFDSDRLQDTVHVQHSDPRCWRGAERISSLSAAPKHLHKHERAIPFWFLGSFVPKCLLRGYLNDGNKCIHFTFQYLWSSQAKEIIKESDFGLLCKRQDADPSRALRNTTVWSRDDPLNWCTVELNCE